MTIDLIDISFSRHMVIELSYQEIEFLVRNNLKKCSLCFFFFARFQHGID